MTFQGYINFFKLYGIIQKYSLILLIQENKLDDNRKIFYRLQKVLYSMKTYFLILANKKVAQTKSFEFFRAIVKMHTTYELNS
jgi:hypothetical protein